LGVHGDAKLWYGNSRIQAMSLFFKINVKCYSFQSYFNVLNLMNVRNASKAFKGTGKE
jgi:hypothetical protein